MAVRAGNYQVNMRNTIISNQLDLLVVESLLGDPNIVKTAQMSSMLSGIVDKVKSYISNNIDPNDKAGSVLNMLAPGLIFTTLRAFGIGPIFSALAGLAVRFFHIDVAGILESIYQGLKSELGHGQPTTSEKVDSIVQNAVQQHANTSEMTPITTTTQLRRAKLLRLALLSPDKESLYKKAATKAGTVSLLSQVLSFLFRVVISSAGLMVAGDLINHFLNRPSAIDTPTKGGVPVENQTDTSTPATISVFPLNPSYQDTTRNSSAITWIENISNNAASISQMLINFAKEVYQIPDSQVSVLQSSPAFQNAVESITWYNHEAAGGPVVFIPRMFTTKKQLVDALLSGFHPSTTGNTPAYKL
jgi:hypothetical protein